MKTFQSTILLCAVLFLAGCQTFNDTVVTIRDVRAIALREWADLSVAGRTTPALDARVMEIDQRIQQSAAVAVKAMEEYKATGDRGPYFQAVSTTKILVTELLNTLWPLIPQRTQELQTKLERATF